MELVTELPLRSSTATPSRISHVPTGLPLWKSSIRTTRANCKIYLDSLEDAFNAERFPEQEVGVNRWVSALLKVMTDNEERTWVRRKLVDPNLSWKEARLLQRVLRESEISWLELASLRSSRKVRNLCLERIALFPTTLFSHIDLVGGRNTGQFIIVVIAFVSTKLAVFRMKFINSALHVRKDRRIIAVVIVVTFPRAALLRQPRPVWCTPTARGVQVAVLWTVLIILITR